MRKAFLHALILTILSSPFLFAQQSPPRATLEITFAGIRSDQGLVAIGINEGPEGWPRKPDMDPNWKKANIVSGSMTVKVENLAYGTYAVSMLDDENSNLEMDNNFLGIPKEGFGFSGNPKIGMSPPKFEECSFTIDKPLTKITIEVRYMGKGT